MLQLTIEYHPDPPFACGHPSTADPAIVERVLEGRADSSRARREQAYTVAPLYCRVD